MRRSEKPRRLLPEIKMTDEEIKDSINTIYKHYGVSVQANKLIEECAELIREASTKEFDKMAQEMADVYLVMTGILQNNPELEEIFQGELEFKVTRQLKRIKEDRDDKSNY
jgi:phosphoribosyl-ATP pyrophosphohydrolase